MLVGLLATAIFWLHFLWVVFALLGGLVVLVWSWVIWVHLLAVAWSSAVFVFGWTCPLTPLEKYFRQLAGQPVFDGGFIEHYILRPIGLTGLTRSMEVGFGLSVLAWNVLLYCIFLSGKMSEFLPP